MASSIKKTRLETSNSSKKRAMNTSMSNKSLKALRENKQITKMISNAQPGKNDDKEEKKGAIMVKNIKNKIVGTGHATSKMGKENLHASKKCSKI